MEPKQNLVQEESAASLLKKQMRKSMAEQVRNLPHTRRMQESIHATSLLSMHPWWKKAHTILFYRALTDELNLNDLEDGARAQKKIVILPKVEKNRLSFWRVENISQLKPGAFGIVEPDPGLCQPSDPSDWDLLLIPGRAFDRTGRRLGRGCGYYDGLLHQLSPSSKVLGVAFSCQLVGVVPCEDHDMSVKSVLTGKGWTDCN